jgi:hypothetical protein
VESLSCHDCVSHAMMANESRSLNDAKESESRSPNDEIQSRSLNDAKESRSLNDAKESRSLTDAKESRSLNESCLYIWWVLGLLRFGGTVYRRVLISTHHRTQPCTNLRHIKRTHVM